MLASRDRRTGGAVYVLAQDVDARRAGALMDQMRGPETLDSIGKVPAWLRALLPKPSRSTGAQSPGTGRRARRRAGERERPTVKRSAIPLAGRDTIQLS